MRWLAFALGMSLLVAAGGVAPPASAQTLSEGPVPPKTGGSIGVARFERAGAERETQPDVATLLAKRLGSRGVDRVVGPNELSAEALADPRNGRVVEWAERAAVQAVVVGRTTRIGQRIAVDARLRDGDSGQRLGEPFFADVAGPGDLDAAVDGLADQVIHRFARSGAPALPSVASKPPSVAGGYDRSAPIEIKADELEAADQAGRKRFLFEGNVHAQQGAFSLRADRLEAFYPTGASQPDRLVARGHVRIDQGDRQARCDRAELIRSQDRVVCRGNARLVQACDRVRGQEIVFQLDREILKVNGAADVRIHPRGEVCETSP